MRALVVIVLGVLATACIDPVDPRWQLDHDHVVAVRATPPRLMPGERAVIDGLLAREGAPAILASPLAAVGPKAPSPLAGAVGWIDGAWVVTAPAAEALAAERSVLQLPADAPVPLTIVMAFARDDDEEPMHYVKKTVWLGDRAQNPDLPSLLVDGTPVADEIVVRLDTDVYVSIAAEPGTRVNWLTSCGTLFQDDVATAFVRVLPEDRLDGELAVVLRTADGGVAWRVWPIRAR